MRALQPGSFTIDDYLALPDDGFRYELYDGALHVTGVPDTGHALAVVRLREALARGLPNGYVLAETLGLRLGTARVLIPDLVVVSLDVLVRNVQLLNPTDVLLVVEVESPSSVRMDRLMKTALYAEGGVPQYLRIVRGGSGGPEAHLGRLVGDVYQVASVRAGEVMSLGDPLACAFDPADLVR